MPCAPPMLPQPASRARLALRGAGDRRGGQRCRQRGSRRATAVRTMTGAPIADGADAIVPVERTRARRRHGRNLVRRRAGRVHPPARRGPARRRAGDGAGQAARRRRTSGCSRRSIARWSTYAAARVSRSSPPATNWSTSIRFRPARRSSTPAPTRWPGAVREAGGEAVDPEGRARSSRGNSRAPDRSDSPSTRCSRPAACRSASSITSKARSTNSGMRQMFHGVAQKPGRPLKFGTVGGRPIFGLPGESGLDDGVLLPVRAPRAAQDGRAGATSDCRESRCDARSISRSRKDLTEFVRVRLRARRRRALRDSDRQPGIGNT